MATFSLSPIPVQSMRVWPPMLLAALPGSGVVG